MEKVYLLLRNNCETGPFTYEELLQQNLLPTDLVWIEGKSTVWTNPSAIKKEEPVPTDVIKNPIKEGNTSIVKPTTAEVPWYHRRRSPEAELEAKALALKEQAEAAAKAMYRYPSQPRTFKPSKRNPVVFQEEETELLLEIHRVNKKSVTLPQLIAAGVITALVATGWYNRDKLTIIRPQASMITQAATPVVFQIIPPTVPQPAAAPATNAAVSDTTLITDVATTIKTASATSQKQPAKAKETYTVKDITANEPAVSETATVGKEEKKEDKSIAVSTPVDEKKDAAEVKVTETVTASETVSSGTVKKKGLGEALKKIFKKKKKTEDSSEPE